MNPETPIILGKHSKKGVSKLSVQLKGRQKDAPQNDHKNDRVVNFAPRKRAEPRKKKSIPQVTYTQEQTYELER